MAVVCPNIEDSPAFDAMAVRDSVDYFAMTSDAQSRVVVSGMAVTGTGSMSVAVAGGSVAISGTTYNYTGGTVSVGAASTSDRRDTVVYTAGTGVQVIAGGPCGYTTGIWTQAVTSNNPPVKATVGTYAIPANAVVLAEVYVAKTTTTIVTATNVVDKRNIQSFSGSAPLEQLIRYQSLDQMSPPAADLNFNAKRLTNVAAPVFSSDAVRLGDVTLGKLLGQTTVTATHAYSTSSATMAAVDTTTMTVSFTALSTQVLVTLDASAVYNSSGTGMQVWTLFVHGGTTVAGYYAVARDASTAAINAIPGPARASILVTGLTAGTDYQYDWAWAVSAGTANMSTVAQPSGAVTASNYGSATMSVYSA